MRQPTHVGPRGLLEELLDRRILLLDGAMGSMIYAHEPKEEDYRGTRFGNHPVPLKNCTEVLVLTQPRLIEDIHRAYLEAGADVIETDSFNSSAPIEPSSSRMRSASNSSRRARGSAALVMAEGLPAGCSALSEPRPSGSGAAAAP